MMNKKLLALLVAIATVNASTFALLENTLKNTGRLASDVANTPADIATGGRTYEKRLDRRAQEDEQRRQERMSDRDYYSGATRKVRTSDRYYMGATE